MSNSTVRIEGLSHAAVLAVLYNAAKPQRMGFNQYKAGAMTEAEAQQLLDDAAARGRGYVSFDYLHGRVMKIDFENETEIYVGLYDRDNGSGAAQAAINAYRKTKDVANADVLAQHKENTIAAAADAKDGIERDKTRIEPGVIHLGLDGDVAEPLSKAIDKTLDEL